jgi:hypothetical protein
MGGFTFLRCAFCAPCLALALFLSLAALAVSCKQEPEESGDPHIPLVNPFTGVWQVSGGAALTLTRVSGGPAVLELSNPFVGEWTAVWNTGEHGTTWSWKYRADGTAKTLHHQVRHQFENSYIVRGVVLVLFGGMRFGYYDNAVIAGFEADGSGGFTVTERQETPAPAVWIYTRVSAAPWL